jgi:hypothetical protein
MWQQTALTQGQGNLPTPRSPSFLASIPIVWSGFLLLLLVCPGCQAPPKGHAHLDAPERFAAYKTFALLPVVTTPNLDAGTATALVNAAESGARDALRAKGYVEIEREKADLVFYLHGKAMAPVGVTELGFVSDPAKAAKAGGEADRLFVETYDNQTRRQVWMGWLDCSCKKVQPERVQHEIQRILENFPARVQAVST